MSKTLTYVKSADGYIRTLRSSYPYFSDYEVLKDAEGRRLHIKQTISELRALGVKPGATINTLVSKISASGMTRYVRVFITHKNKIVEITRAIGIACDYKFAEHDGLRINGCGFNAGFDVVYALGDALWPRGTRTAHSTRNGAPDHSGGYALTHREL